MNGGLKAGQKVCFMVLNVRYSKGPPDLVIRLFDNLTRKCFKRGMFEHSEGSFFLPCINVVSMSIQVIFPF